MKSFIQQAPVVLSNSPSNSPRKLLNYPPFCKFIQVLFNYFNLYEIIRHFDWSPGLIRGPDQKKLNIFQLFIIRPATSPDQSEPKISTDGACADFVLFRSACYFPEWKLALKGQVEWSDRTFQSHILHFVNFIQVFNYFNLCEIISHFDWSLGLIRGPDKKKLKIFHFLLSIQRPRRIDRNQKFQLMAHAPILFCSEPIRSAAYFPEWKLAFTGNCWIGPDRKKTSIRSDPLLIFRSGNWPLLEIACWIGPDRKNIQSVHDPTNRYGPHKLSSGFTDRANRTVRENYYSFKKMENSRFRCVFLDNYYLLINFWL